MIYKYRDRYSFIITIINAIIIINSYNRTHNFIFYKFSYYLLLYFLFKYSIHQTKIYYEIQSALNRYL